MKPIRPDEKIGKLIEEFEGKKQYATMNANMKSKIVGHSNDIDPTYFIRADYFTDERLSREPQEHWSIPNPFTPYYESCRSQMENLKALSKVEKDMGLKTSTDFYYKKIKDRYNFLLQQRKINPVEMEERIKCERIQFLIRD